MMLTWSSAAYTGQYIKSVVDNALNSKCRRFMAASTISYKNRLCAQTLNGVEVVTVTDFTRFPVWALRLIHDENCFLFCLSLQFSFLLCSATLYTSLYSISSETLQKLFNKWGYNCMKYFIHSIYIHNKEKVQGTLMTICFLVGSRIAQHPN